MGTSSCTARGPPGDRRGQDLAGGLGPPRRHRPDSRPGGSAGPADPAGQLLGRLSVLPALLVLAWLLAGLPLLLLGWFTPVLTLVISVPLAAALVLAGLRWIPGLRQEPGRTPEQASTRPRRGPPGGPWPQ